MKKRAVEHAMLLYFTSTDLRFATVNEEKIAAETQLSRNNESTGLAKHRRDTVK